MHKDLILTIIHVSLRINHLAVFRICGPKLILLTLNSHLMNRLCIYPKDISIITGKGQRWSQRLLKNIKFVLKKEEHQLVTQKEFAEYMGIDHNLVISVCR